MKTIDRAKKMWENYNRKKRAAEKAKNQLDKSYAAVVDQLCTGEVTEDEFFALIMFLREKEGVSLERESGTNTVKSDNNTVEIEKKDSEVELGFERQQATGKDAYTFYPKANRLKNYPLLFRRRQSWCPRRRGGCWSHTRP